MNFRTPLLAGCALVALASGSPVLAQTTQPATPPPVEDTTTSRVGEITVTAERREQSLQDVPIAITAFDDTTRENVGILTIQDMSQFTPGLYYNTTTDRPAIRGIGRQSNTFSLDSPVANYFDGVYTSSVQDASRRPIFIERTEVLRGPQGALSGRGSIAGAINTISKMPSKEFGGIVGGFLGNFERYGLEGTVTGPVTDWMQYRFNAGYYRQNKGFFTNLADGGTEGDQPNNRSNYELLLTGDLGEKFDFFLKAGFSNYDESRRTNVSLAPYIGGSDPCIPSIGAGSAPAAGYGYFGPGLACGQVRLPVVGAPTTTFVPFDNKAVLFGNQRTNPATPDNLRVYNSDYHSRQTLDDQHNYTAHLTYHSPWADVKWIGGHQNYRYTQLTDVDDTPVQSYLIGSAAYNPLDPANPIISTRRIRPGGFNLYQEEREWYSNEVNLTSTTEGRFQWILGLYESNEQYEQTPQGTFYPGFNLSQPTFTLAGTPAGPIAPNQVANRLTYGHLVGETISRAVYAQGDFKFNDEWKVTGGLRYNNDDKEVDEDARYLSVTPTVGGDFVGDNTFAFFRGYGVVSTATAIVPPGYSLIDPSIYPFVVGDNTLRLLPDGSTVAATGQSLLFAPGVVGFPSTNATTGARQRKLKNDWQALTGSIGVDYSPNADTLVYARFARGYRPGGFNSGFINAIPEVEEEQVNSYEVGTKFTYSGTLRLNAAAFYYDYTDIQVQLPIFDRCTVPGDFATCSSVNTFINLPSAVNKGIELEAVWYPTNNWQFLLTYGYLDAKIKNGVTTQGFENGNDPSALLPTAQPYLPIQNCLRNVGVPVTTACTIGTTGTAVPQRDSITGLPRFTQDLSGNHLIATPKHKIALNANYTFRNVWDAGDLTVSASYIWRDKSFTDLFGSTNSMSPSYSQSNVRAVFKEKDDVYQLIFYVQNVFDENVAEFASVTRRSVSGPGSGQVFYKGFDLAPPRTFGVEVQRRF